MKQGRINYSTNNETFLVQMAGPDSKVAKTCALSLIPGGPAGRFPNVAAHGWGIPVGSRNKDAAWEFINWAMSKQMTERMFRENAYSSVTRRSMIDRPEFRQKMMINGIDVAQIYLDTLTLGARVTRYTARCRPIRRSIARSTSPSRRIVSEAEERQGGDGAGAAQRVDPVEARRREAVDRCRPARIARGWEAEQRRSFRFGLAPALLVLAADHAGAGGLFVRHQPDAADAGQSRHGV